MAELRELDESDAATLAQGFVDDPAMGAMLGLEDDPSPEEMAEWIASQPGRMRAGERVELAVAVRDENDAVGTIALHHIDWRHHRCELGLYLLPGARGRGLGVEAIELLIGWGAAELEMHRFQLTTVTRNRAMRRLAERAGFALEGTLRHYSYERGRFVDNLMYARIAP